MFATLTTKIDKIYVILPTKCVLLLPQKLRLTGKDVIFITRKRQYWGQWLFGFFYIKQYPGIKYNQISSHVTIKLSKRSVVRHMIKRAIMQYIQEHDIVKNSISDVFYKIFIVLSKDRVWEIDKKIANLSKKDTIRYMQDEFGKAWKWFTGRFPVNWKF